MSSNAISLSRQIAQAGVEKHIADAVAEGIVSYTNDALATKADLADVKGELRSEIADAKSELRSEIADVKSELRSEIADAKSELRSEITDVKVDLMAEIAEVKKEGGRTSGAMGIIGIVVIGIAIAMLTGGV